MTMNVRTRFTLFFSAVVVTAAIAAPAVQAGDPTGAQYENGVTQIEKGVGGGNGKAKTSHGPLNSPVVSGLPFTGLDLVRLGAVAIALMSLGLALRRLTVSAPLK